MKAKTVKRSIAMALAAVMMLTGCKSGGDAPAAASDNGSGTFETTYGAKQFDDAKITVMVYDRNTAPDGSTVTNNRWTDYIKEEMKKVGIIVEFVAIPRNGDVEKVQTMMAAGTAPDLVMTYNGIMVEDYFNQGGIYDLSPYVDGENQAKNLKEYVHENVLDAGRNGDGNLWGISARRSIASKSNMFIRKDWLDKLGMEIPTTPDELYEVLKAFKNNNPDGRTDVIPFAAYDIDARKGTVISLAFAEHAGDEIQHNINVNSSIVYTDDGHVEYLRWLNKLYNEGLIDQEYYAASNGDQARREYFVNGQLGFYLYNVNGNVDSLRGELLQNLKANYPDADMVSMPPMKNIHDGQQYNDGYPESGAYVFIPKTCKNPEAAVTYLDWLSTKEGGFTLFHGFEGEHYIDEDGIPVVKDAAFNATDKDWIRHDLFLVGNQGYYQTEEDFIKSTAKEIPGYEDYVTNNYNNAISGIIRCDTIFVPPTQAENSTEIDLAGDENLVKCITCPPEEFDANIAVYREALKNVGMDQIVKECTEYYKSK